MSAIDSAALKMVDLRAMRRSCSERKRAENPCRGVRREGRKRLCWQLDAHPAGGSVHPNGALTAMGPTLHFTTAAVLPRRSVLCLACGLLGCSLMVARAESGQVWRLKDAQGRTVFTDRVSEDDIASGRAQPVKVEKVTPEMAAQAQAKRQTEQVEIDRYNQQLQRRSDAARAVELARQHLEQAQALYLAGEAPREEESNRVRTGSRLSERYAQRRLRERQAIDNAALALQRALAYQASLP